MPYINVHIEPGKQVSWNEFNSLHKESIALDGYVVDGPQWDEETLNANFDHHNNVVREATMSSAMQVFFAIKGGILTRYPKSIDVYINDVDQDTCMAVWLLTNHRFFEGTNSVPHVNRIMALNDKMDITGGSFPILLNDKVYHQHCWVFQPYTDLRKSGEIAKLNETVYKTCLESVLARLDRLLMGTAEEYVPKVTYDILMSSNGLVVADESIGGIEARHAMFAANIIKWGYLSIVAKRDDGKFVYTVGRKSRYIKMNLKEIYKALNELEQGCDNGDCWGGSDIIGGSPRKSGSALTWQQVADVIRRFS